MTHSVPMYKIETPPQLGDIVKLREPSRRKRDVSSADFNDADVVLNFTHLDVLSDVIAYRAKGGMTYEDRTDSFLYRVFADDVQPAADMFYLTVAASHRTTTPKVTMAPTTESAAVLPEQPVTEVTAKSAGTEKKLLIVIVVVIVTCSGASKSAVHPK